MAVFRKIAVILLTVLYPIIGHILVHTENKLADCLLASIGGLTNNTIHISIEVEDVTIRRSFEDTAGRFLVKNDAVLVDLDSKESCNIFIRLFFVDSIKSFKNLIDRQRSRECDTSSGNQYYFVVLPNSVLLEEILNFCWKAYILNVNVLIEDENKIVTLYTYYPFTKSKCRDSMPTLHNRFINGSFEWSKELFPPKMDNLWQCPIKAIVSAQYPYIWVEHNQIYGINGNVFKTLATKMNFSIEMIMSEFYIDMSHSKNSVIGVSKLLQDNFGDILLEASGSGSDLNRKTNFDSTVSFYTGYFCAVVKRPKSYRSLGVIFLPFDGLTWISLFTIVLAKWICQILWKKYANIRVVFRYFSTHLHTMAWLYAMFIVRSSYEGSIFRFLQYRPRQWIPQNIDVAVDNGYKFVASAYWYTTLQQVPQLVDHLVIHNGHPLHILRSLNVDKGKYAVIAPNIFLSRLCNDPSMCEDYALVPTPISMIDYWLEMQKYSFLTEAINTRIHKLLANGYIQRNFEKHVPMDRLMKTGKNDERASISLHHIKGTFILLAICTVVSIFAFVAEVFAQRYPLLKKLLKLFD